MARLYYMSLRGVGPWDSVIKEIGAQFRPYQDYLFAALKAAERRKPVLAWRRATPAEKEVFARRHMERRGRRLATPAGKEVKGQGKAELPAGEWVVLEAPPWRPEEPEDTFKSFFEDRVREVYEAPFYIGSTSLTRQAIDREGRALLLARLPKPLPAPSAGADEGGRPTAAAPFGPLLWLRPRTYTLQQQLYAVQDLDNSPTPRLAPLVRLAATQATWEDLDVHGVQPAPWVFLGSDRPDARLRDGTNEQRRFVEIALATPDFAILDGPPGSGKTTAICELIVQLARLGKRVLLVASTHVAVDNVLERLLEWQNRDDTPEKFVLPIRIGEEDDITSDTVARWSYRRLLKTWRTELLQFLARPTGVEPSGAAARSILREALQRQGDDEAPLTRLLLESANLVCGTTIGILQHPAIKAARKGASFEPFDVMILDEASKTTFSEFLVPARHARRWIVSGDIKQLSPFVEEADLEENIRGLVPEATSRAAVHAFLCSRAGGRVPRVPRAFIVRDDEDARLIRDEAAGREVAAVDLDGCRPITLRGVPGAVPELLYADLVIGGAGAFRKFERRLPPGTVVFGDEAPRLPDLDAAACAFERWGRRQERPVDIPGEPAEWGYEVAWRLIRSYELRQNPAEGKRYSDELVSLLPVTLGNEWFAWRKMQPRGRDGVTETARDALSRELATMRRVAMPSILEILQKGFERLPGWHQGVALTDGLPPHVLEKRLVSLSYQHRMHPDISVFPRERFYTPDPANLGQKPVLLLDAKGMEADRAWEYGRYARRALWMDVVPGRGRGRPRAGNVNLAEVEKILVEASAFRDWASQHPCKDRNGRERAWEIAVLPFYRGQEFLLRDEMRRLSGQWGNSRNFHLARNVHLTLCTVDRFQGHEADVVLLSFVNHGVGFLNSPNRLNVALTRARYQVVLIGHRSAFARCRSPLLVSLAESKHYHGDIAWEDAR